MQAVIVAGGRGERMRPATDLTPKPLLPLAGKPVIDRQLEWLAASGIKDVLLSLGYRADAFREHCGDGSRWGLKLGYSVEKEARGTAGGVKDLGKLATGELLVVYGDLFIEMDLGRLSRFHAAHDGAATIVARLTDHPYDSDLLRTDGDRVTGIYRAKPGEKVEPLGCAAVWVVRPRLLDLVPKDRPTDFAKDTFPAALAKGETLMAYRTDERVLDVGTPERLARLEKSFREKSR